MYMYMHTYIHLHLLKEANKSILKINLKIKSHCVLHKPSKNIYKVSVILQASQKINRENQK